MGITFKTWLKEFEQEESSWGDFAGDVAADTRRSKNPYCRITMPIKNTLEAWIDYLPSSACDEAKKALCELWIQYQIETKYTEKERKFIKTYMQDWDEWAEED